MKSLKYITENTIHLHYLFIFILGSQFITSLRNYAIY